MKRALRLTSSILGICAGLLAVQHGIFEVLQGNRATGSLMIQAVGAPCQPDTHQHGVELDERAPVECEPNRRDVSPGDSGRDRHVHRSVAREWQLRAAHREQERPRRTRVAREPDVRKRAEESGGGSGRSEQTPPCESRAHGLEPYRGDRRIRVSAQARLVRAAGPE